MRLRDDLGTVQSHTTLPKDTLFVLILILQMARIWDRQSYTLVMSRLGQ
jgi:hypothetical protein